MSYHIDGTLASHMDFNGVTRTYEYDAGRRLIRRAYPDGSEDLFTYTPSGQRASATHAGRPTTYAYDDLGRLIEKVDPTGHKLSYTYDSRQLFEYVHLLRLNAPQIDWRPGISYKPPRRFIVAGVFGSMRIRTFGPRLGLIQYRADSTTRLRSPGPGVSIALQQTLIVALMLASLMAAMRRPV